MLISNPHISPHQQRPKKLHQDHQIHKQITLNHQHASLFQDNPYTVEERHARLSAPLEPVNRQAHCSQFSNGNKNKLDHESFYRKNTKRLLHLSPEDCKNELKRLKITSNKGTNRKIVNFQVFPDSAHQAELERYQGHIRLDTKYPFHGAHGRLTYDLHDRNWIPNIGINNPSNCKADTKNKRIPRNNVF